MQCGWLLPQVVNQKQTTIEPWNLKKGNNFLLGSSLIHTYKSWKRGHAASVLNNPLVASVSPNVTILAPTCQSHEIRETAELTCWTNAASLGWTVWQSSLSCLQKTRRRGISLCMRAVAPRNPRAQQIILLSAGAKATNAVMQITADSVKIKPFIFICLSTARDNIWHSH